MYYESRFCTPVAPDIRDWLGAGEPIIVGMVPAVGGLLAIGWLYEAWLPQQWRPLTAPLGVMLVLVGVSVIWLSFSHLRAARASDQLCTTGPYRYVRHPLYAAWLWLLIPGGTLLIGLWPLIGAVPILYVLTRFYIPNEEATLSATFGTTYERYAESVPALVPRPGTRANG